MVPLVCRPGVTWGDSPEELADEWRRETDGGKHHFLSVMTQEMGLLASFSTSHLALRERKVPVPSWAGSVALLCQLAPCPGNRKELGVDLPCSLAKALRPLWY